MNATENTCTAVEATQAAAQAGSIDWESRPIEELIDHILARYHRPLDLELMRLEGLMRNVVYAHGQKDPERMTVIYRTFQSLREELERHMSREEQNLFPWILAGQGHGANEPVHAMMLEHQSMGWLLERLRTLAAEFPMPEGECRDWLTLWEGIESLETDLEEHSRLEHEILFPRVLRRI